jgi:hypothetical protein
VIGMVNAAQSIIDILAFFLPLSVFSYVTLSLWRCFCDFATGVFGKPRRKF